MHNFSCRTRKGINTRTVTVKGLAMNRYCRSGVFGLVKAIVVIAVFAGEQCSPAFGQFSGVVQQYFESLKRNESVFDTELFKVAYTKASAEIWSCEGCVYMHDRGAFSKIAPLDWKGVIIKKPIVYNKGCFLLGDMAAPVAVLRPEVPWWMQKSKSHWSKRERYPFRQRYENQHWDGRDKIRRDPRKAEEVLWYSVALKPKPKYADKELLYKPTKWDLVWRDTGTGANKDCAIWKMKGPSEYVACGLVVTNGDEPPEDHPYRMIKQVYRDKYLARRSAYISFDDKDSFENGNVNESVTKRGFWNDKHSGAKSDVERV